MNLHKFDEPEKDNMILLLLTFLNKENKRHKKIEQAFSFISVLFFIFCFLLVVS